MLPFKSWKLLMMTDSNKPTELRGPLWKSELQLAFVSGIAVGVSLLTLFEVAFGVCR